MLGELRLSVTKNHLALGEPPLTPPLTGRWRVQVEMVLLPVSHVETPLRRAA